MQDLRDRVFPIPVYKIKPNKCFMTPFLCLYESPGMASQPANPKTQYRQNLKNQWNQVNTGAKGTLKSVRIKRALRISLTGTCFIDTKTKAEHFLTAPDHTANDMQLIPIENVYSNRDSVRTAREAFLLSKGRTPFPHGLNKSILAKKFTSIFFSFIFFIISLLYLLYCQSL